MSRFTTLSDLAEMLYGMDDFVARILVANVTSSRICSCREELFVFVCTDCRYSSASCTLATEADIVHNLSLATGQANHDIVFIAQICKTQSS